MTASLWIGINDRSIMRLDVYLGDAARVSLCEIEYEKDIFMLTPAAVVFSQ